MQNEIRRNAIRQSAIKRNEMTPVIYLLMVSQKMVQKKWWKTKQSLSKRQKMTKQIVVVGPPIKKN